MASWVRTLRCSLWELVAGVQSQSGGSEAWDSEWGRDGSVAARHSCRAEAAVLVLGKAWESCVLRLGGRELFPRLHALEPSGEGLGHVVRRAEHSTSAVLSDQDRWLGDLERGIHRPRLQLDALILEAARHTKQREEHHSAARRLPNLEALPV